MALQLETSTPYGLQLSDAYVRITAFSGDREHISYRIQTWASQAARQAGALPLGEQWGSFEYPADGLPDVMRACYEHLKVQPGYERAIDA